jgi:hypothetical protein
LHNAKEDFGEADHTLLYLVDDEESIRVAVGKFLAGRNYHVQTFEDGLACLEELRAVAATTSPENDSATVARLPELVVSDVRMPRLDGLQLLRAVRGDARLAPLPVVLLTARGTTPDRIDGYNAGADAYVPKPFDPEELVSVVERVMAAREAVAGSGAGGEQDLQSFKKDLDQIRQLLLEQGGAGPGFNGFVRNKDARNEDRVFLAPDERDILERLCRGLTNREIAEEIFLSTRRVEQILTNMYRKVKVKNRTELVRWAVASGLVQL